MLLWVYHQETWHLLFLRLFVILRLSDFLLLDNWGEVWLLLIRCGACGYYIAAFLSLTNWTCTIFNIRSLLHVMVMFSLGRSFPAGGKHYLRSQLCCWNTIWTWICSEQGLLGLLSEGIVNNCTGIHTWMSSACYVVADHSYGWHGIHWGWKWPTRNFLWILFWLDLWDATYDATVESQSLFVHWCSHHAMPQNTLELFDANSERDECQHRVAWACLCCTTTENALFTRHTWFIAVIVTAHDTYCDYAYNAGTTATMKLGRETRWI